MRRREFITLIGVAAAAWPMAVHAQQPRKLPSIGFLGAATVTAWRANVPAFVQRLSELGWAESRTLAIEYRWADGRPERLQRYCGRVRPAKGRCHRHGGNRHRRGKAGDVSYPDVFAMATEPVSTGLIASLARRALMSRACR